MSAHYLPVDAQGCALVTSCDGCRREIVPSANNAVGAQFLCRSCKVKAESPAPAKAAA